MPLIQRDFRAPGFGNSSMGYARTMIGVDLHTHSDRSDGLLSPDAMVQRAAKQGVTLLALTDHDDLSGISDARIAAERYGIRLVPGVEVSALWGDLTVHILGLGIDPEETTLVEGLIRNRAGRTGRAQRIAEDLARAGIPGSLEGALRHARNPDLVSRTHFARFLVQSGRAANTASVFRHFLVEGKPGYVPHEWAGLADAVQWITSAGGIPVIAHPGRYKLSLRQREALVEAFKDAGGRGIEVVAAGHNSDDRYYWGRLAMRSGLYGSAGSDFHEPRDSGRDMGGLAPLPDGVEPVWNVL